jgi:hypothetical protein
MKILLKKDWCGKLAGSIVSVSIPRAHYLVEIKTAAYENPKDAHIEPVEKIVEEAKKPVKKKEQKRAEK